MADGGAVIVPQMRAPRRAAPSLNEVDATSALGFPRAKETNMYGYGGERRNDGRLRSCSEAG